MLGLLNHVIDTAEKLDSSTIDPNDKVKEDGWNVAQILHHMADATLMYYSRIILVLSEENPTIVPWNQDRIADRPFSQDPQNAVHVSLPLTILLTRKLIRILQDLKNDDLIKQGNHLELGTVSLAQMIELCAQHNLSHLKQLHQLQEGP